jgi:hypothetical protein
MTRIALGLLTLLLAGSASHFPFAYAQDGVCDGSELPCDPDRPWMRGTVEKKCSRLGDPEAGVEKCACVHTCDKKGSPDDETQGRTWDARCGARCDPKGCTCPTKCET